MPASSVLVPSVTTKAEIRKRTTSRPLTRPISGAGRSATTIDATTPRCCFPGSPTTSVATSVATAATERSNSPTTIGSMIARATNTTTTCVSRIARKFSSVP